MEKALPPPQGGWRILEWCPAARFSRPFVYKLFGSELSPKNVKIGTARFIIESPAEYFARIAKLKKSKAAKAAKEAKRKASGQA